jgi:plasmid stabilization system protein ParE
MAFTVIFKPLAQLEVGEAYEWYQQDHIRMGDAFLEQLERTSNFLRGNPDLYPKVQEDLHRANLNQFPYSLFYVIDGDTVNILSCFHQHRDPRNWPAQTH